jgi:hypothetical protein
MLVPPPVQHEIATQAPHVAYVPSRLAPGWRYETWVSPHGEVEIVFGKAAQQIIFIAAPFSGDCAFSAKRTLRIGGLTVYWNHTAAEQRAWRCVKGVRLLAATSLPTDVGLGRLVASAHRVTG